MGFAWKVSGLQPGNRPPSPMPILLVRRSRSASAPSAVVRRHHESDMLRHLLEHWAAFQISRWSYFTRDIYRLLLEEQAVIQRMAEQD